VADQTIQITAMEPDHFGVQVHEGAVATSHRVRVPPAMVDDLGLAGIEPERIVRVSFEFLLEREPNTAILRDFALDEIARYFPEYYDELRTRVGPVG